MKCQQHKLRERRDSFEYECLKCGLRATPSFHLRPHCDVALIEGPDESGWARGYLRRRDPGSDSSWGNLTIFRPWVGERHVP